VWCEACELAILIPLDRFVVVYLHSSLCLI